MSGLVKEQDKTNKDSETSKLEIGLLFVLITGSLIVRSLTSFNNGEPLLLERIFGLETISDILKTSAMETKQVYLIFTVMTGVLSCLYTIQEFDRIKKKRKIN